MTDDVWPVADTVPTVMSVETVTVQPAGVGRRGARFMSRFTGWNVYTVDVLIAYTVVVEVAPVMVVVGNMLRVDPLTDVVKIVVSVTC